jgi:hypothetical protein
MLAIQEAAERAVAFAREIYGADAIKELRIDEVERDKDTWQITLSWSTPGVTALGLMFSNRTYKQFVVNSVNGEVKSMHIRKVD